MRQVNILPHIKTPSIAHLVTDDRFFHYLNEGFQGGETHFYLPKIVKQETIAMTTEEEIKAEGGPQNGFDLVNIVPRTSLAVVFSQNVLHKSTPLEMQETPDYKLVLKTDVMLRRKDKPFGFSVSLEEKKDYFLSSTSSTKGIGGQNQ